MHYFFRETRSGNYDRVEVAKFDPHKFGPPLDVYNIQPMSSYCSCPSPKNPCKHQFMYLKWVTYGPNRFKYAYDDDKEEFFEHPLANFLLTQGS